MIPGIGLVERKDVKFSTQPRKFDCSDSSIGMRCWEILGTWDPIPGNYDPARMYDFPAGHLTQPREYGAYATEQRDPK